MRKVLQLILIVSVFAFSGTTVQANSSPASVAPGAIQLPEFMTFGKEDAPVSIIEFSSYTCPHCAHFHQGNRKWIMENFVDTGRAKYIFHDYPLDRLSAAISMIVHHAPKSTRPALSELFFEKQTEWYRAENPFNVLINLAALSGMTRETVEKAVEDGPLLKGLIKSRQDATKRYGVNATPMLAINGQLVAANEEKEKLTQMIEAAEAAARKKKL